MLLRLQPSFSNLEVLYSSQMISPHFLWINCNIRGHITVDSYPAVHTKRGEEDRRIEHNYDDDEQGINKIKV